MLANDPVLWLMDEPLAAVDLQTRIILQEELLRLWGDEQSRGAAAHGDVRHPRDRRSGAARRSRAGARATPGRVKALVEVPLERPRARLRTSPEIALLVEQVWTLIRDEAAQAIVEEVQ
jgi:NitT/TauT family transport system ATP-binding protein